jgi:aspartyl-tRNA(Asn)/glutamyl-tRNA(Gln) amidotransferase subunit B
MAVEFAIRLGLALGASVAEVTRFDRKQYFYPDLPKGYQISQFDGPVTFDGKLVLGITGREKTVGIIRAHLEEDAGKGMHEEGGRSTLIDLNRCGIPLLEIVSEPDLRSAEEAVAYAKALHGLVRWIGICDGNMQEGSFRCDANVSVRRPGAPLGTRCEIKNLNSFRFLERAIAFEVRRQVELIEEGGTVVQETRLYDPDRNQTRPMRSKEDAQDYRYFPDPDLPPLVIDAAWIDRVRAGMPELPQAMQARFEADYALAAQDATLLTQSRELAAYFEDAVRAYGGEARTVANWMLGEVAAALNKSEGDIASAPVRPAGLAGLLRRVADGTISARIAKDVFDAMWAGEASGDHAADALIEKKGLKQISDAGALGRLVDDVLAANPAIVAEFRAGKEKAFNSLVGKAMAATKGKADPAQVNATLRRKLST